MDRKPKRQCFTWLLAVTCLCIPFRSVCQAPELKTFISTDHILIGEQVKLTIKAGFPTGVPFSGISLQLPDSIPHFEFVEAGKADSVSYKDASKSIEQSFLFTSFDSGKWTLPAFPVTLQQPGGENQRLFSDSFTVSVGYMVPDSSLQPRDIKAIMPVSVTNYTPWYIAGGILLLGVLSWLVWRYLKKKERSNPVTDQSPLSPYEEAMRELERIATLDTSEPVRLKEYHTACAMIIKNYLGRRQHRAYAASTTGDLLIGLSGDGIDPAIFTRLAGALRCTDAVKFAKYRPAADESEECRQSIREAIIFIEKKSKA